MVGSCPLQGTAVRAGLTTTTLLLTYPHLVAGTLPLNRHASAILPKGHGERTAVTLIDGRWGNRFQGWVNHAGRYVAGLRPWFEKHKLPAGAFITLERRDESGEIVVDFRPKRMRRESTRFAQPADGSRLDIQLRKQEVACEYDEQMIIGDDRNEEILKLRTTPTYVLRRWKIWFSRFHRPGRIEPDRQRPRQDHLQRSERAAPVSARAGLCGAGKPSEAGSRRWRKLPAGDLNKIVRIVLHDWMETTFSRNEVSHR